MSTSSVRDERDLALEALASSSLRRAGAAEAELYLSSTHRGFARFGRSRLDQHQDLEEPVAVARVARGRKVAEVRVERLEEDSIARALERAGKLADALPEDPSFEGFARGSLVEDSGPARFDAGTEAASAEERTERLAPVMERIRARGLYAAGVLETRVGSVCVATTGGVLRSKRSSLALFKVWAAETAGAGGASGFGHAMHRALSSIDVDERTAHAIELAERSKHPVEVAPKRYDVVLEPAALGELLEWLAMTSLGAREFSQGSSLLAGRIGEGVLGPSITLREDPLRDDEHGFALPFDREGVSRQSVALVEQGIARGVLYDRAWAGRAHRGSTGNAAPPLGWFDAPQPSNLVLEGGAAASVDELIAGVERGIYVNSFHYVNGYLDTRKATMTGMTRDGALLIENGKITQAIRNLRFTESLAEASFRMDGMTRRLASIPGEWGVNGAIVCPAVRIRDFAFTGAS